MTAAATASTNIHTNTHKRSLINHPDQFFKIKQLFNQSKEQYLYYISQTEVNEG